MAPRKGGTANKSGSKGAPKKRVAANGYKLPDPIASGVVISDVGKKQWVIGRSIGVGGFGEIYLASDEVKKPVSSSADHVIKVEPHSNGPLFAEMHCYMRVAKPNQIEAWKKEKKLKRLGMPKYLGSGSFDYNKNKYRFMVMERFGLDLQKILEQHSKRFSFKTVYQVGIQILDVLEYIHSKEYIHADIKASNLLVGHKSGTENQVFLVDFGLACRYANDGKHKEYKYDQRKAHDGTIEFTSRDAHIGAHSRRGDLEILGYNMTQWLCSRLPWEDNLQDCNYVFTQKRGFMENIASFIKQCFPDTEPPGLRKYLEYVVGLAFDEKPDYEKCRNILRDGLRARGYKDDGKLVFMSATPVPASRKQKSHPERKKTTKRRSEEEENISDFTPKKMMRTSNISPCRPRNKRVNTRTCPRSSLIGISLSKPCQPEFAGMDTEEVMIEKENQKMAARKEKQRPKRLALVKDKSLDNPTPQMIAIMNKIREKSASPPICQKRHRHNSNCNSYRSSPTSEDPPTQFTPEMEAVMRRRAERLTSSDSETDCYSSSSSGVGSPQMFESSESEDSNDATVYYSPTAPSPPYVAPQYNNTLKNVKVMAEYTNEFQRENCVICLKTFNAESSPTAVGKKGLNTLIDFSKRLNWKNLENYLKTCHHENTKILVHKVCRRNFTDVRRSLRNLEQEPVQSKQLRSSIEPFSWKTNCFLCSKEANMDKNHPDRDLAFSVTTILFQNEILERCQNRNDEWGCEVEARLSCRSDLVTDGVYHKQCLRRFMLNWPSPDAEPKPVGQATDEKMLQWFNMLCIWLEVEADGELYTVRELHTKMSELAEGVVVYSVKWLREKLKDRYQQSIYFAQIDGRSDVVCFRNMADYIISDKWYESRKVDKVKDAERIVITAAKLIMAEIQEKKYDTSYYPKHDDIVCHEEQKEWMPNNLKKFLEILIGPPVKQNSIGQRIVHASHPRSGN